MKTHIIQFGVAVLLLMNGRTPAHAQNSPTPVATKTQISKPRLSAQEAVQMASTFCQKAGVPTSVQGEASFPSSVDSPGLAAYIHPLWLITFKGQALVEVDDQNGTIRSYQNEETLLAFDKTPVSDADLSDPVQVQQKAFEVLEAAGDAQGLSFQRIQKEQITSPPTVGGASWWLSWGRLYRGLPFPEQGLIISFSGVKGSLLMLRRNYTLSEPTSDVIKISPDRASHIASEYLLANLPKYLAQRTDSASQRLLNAIKGKTAAFFPARLQLEVLPSNEFWQTYDPMSPEQGPTRVTWLGIFRFETIDYSVWIDANTGVVTGGSVYKNVPR